MIISGSKKYRGYGRIMVQTGCTVVCNHNFGVVTFIVSCTLKTDVKPQLTVYVAEKPQYDLGMDIFGPGKYHIATFLW